MAETMDWRKYEKYIYDTLKTQYPEAEITFDVKLPGRYSNTERQIDILIQDYVAGNRMSIVVDAKYFNSNIDVKCVETFIGMLADLNVHKGLLITQEGYSEAAIKRAFNDPTDIELDILNFKELKKFQAFGAIPFAGGVCVFLPAPFGWIVDANAAPCWLATLYQQGLTLEEAQLKNEWMYVNFWNRKNNNESVNDLLRIQEQTFVGLNPKIEMLPTIRRKDNRTALRKVTIDTYPTPEFTGYVEFDDFIFFAVMFSPREHEKKNIRKLENIMMRITPGKVKYVKEQPSEKQHQIT